MSRQTTRSKRISSGFWYGREGNIHHLAIGVYGYEGADGVLRGPRQKEILAEGVAFLSAKLAALESEDSEARKAAEGQ